MLLQVDKMFERVRMLLLSPKDAVILVSNSFCIKGPVSPCLLQRWQIIKAEDSYGFPVHHRGGDRSCRFRVMGVYFLEIFQDSAKKECFCKYGETPELY